MGLIQRVVEIMVRATLGTAFVAAGPVYAESKSPDLLSPSASATDPVSGAMQVAVSPVQRPAATPARVTVSRAGDYVGTPVYFSQSRGLGSAGVVSISSRRLPPGAVFSVALRPRIAPSSLSLASLSGAMPSLMPVAARALTSGFGLRVHPLLGTVRAHNGLDLAAPHGSPIVATSDGVVSAASWNGGYGLFVALEHGKGIQTRYGHMSRLNVAAGQQIRKGDVIGYVGSTGRSTGPHLHYEVRVDGRPVDPAGHLPHR